MSQSTATGCGSAENEETITIKSEPVQFESAGDILGTNSHPSSKRKRRSTVQYVDLDPDDDDFEQVVVKSEKPDDTQKSAKTKSTSTRVRANIIGRYQETTRRYKKELTALPNPKRIPPDKLPEFYENSMKLVHFMKEEYEDRHAELLNLKTVRTRLNAKIDSQKNALVEAKEMRQKAEIKAEVFEKSSQDANMQLTLKVARPISRAQMKLEYVHEEHTAELALLHAQIAEKEANEKAAEEARLTAERELAELRATGTLQALSSELTQEVSGRPMDLEHVRKLLTASEASIAAATAAKTRLEAKLMESESKSQDAANELATARIEFATEKASLGEANKKLKAENLILDERVTKQKAILDRVMKDERFLDYLMAG